MRSMRKTLLMAAMSCCLPMFMSDAEAGVPSSTEPVQSPDVPQASGQTSVADTSAAAGAGEAGKIDAEPAAAAPADTSATTSAPGAGSDATPVAGEQGNVSGSQSSSALASEPAGEPSRDSLLLRMHAAIDALEAKIATGVHVFAHEVAALRDHIEAVL